MDITKIVSFALFSSVREKLQFTVFLNHPVLQGILVVWLIFSSSMNVRYHINGGFYTFTCFGVFGFHTKVTAGESLRSGTLIVWEIADSHVNCISISCKLMFFSWPRRSIPAVGKPWQVMDLELSRPNLPDPQIVPFTARFWPNFIILTKFHHFG